MYKYKGETPLEALTRFRKKTETNEEKWTYLGRLDPVADGVLLVGNGEDTSDVSRQKYMSLDKEYEFKVLFGFTTDTYDILGKILRVEPVELSSRFSGTVLMRLAGAYKGEREQKYPAYSSKMLNKSPEEQEEVPPKMVTIFDCEYLDLKTMSPKELLGYLITHISKVTGDFRQEEILSMWKEKLEKTQTELYVATYKAHVSSGTYIRSIVQDMGITLGLGACALSITRTRVGDFKIEESVR